MRLKNSVRLIEGTHWFRVEHAAELLASTKPAIMRRIWNGEVESLAGPRGSVYVPEAWVTAERRKRDQVGQFGRQRVAEPAKLATVQARVVRHRERPQDQGVLDWSKFPRSKP